MWRMCACVLSMCMCPPVNVRCTLRPPQTLPPKTTQAIHTHAVHTHTPHTRQTHTHLGPRHHVVVVGVGQKDVPRLVLGLGVGGREGADGGAAQLEAGGGVGGAGEEDADLWFGLGGGWWGCD